MKTKSRPKESIRGAFTALAGVLILFGILGFFEETGKINSYVSGILIQCCYATIMVTSLNIATGFLGQTALGHAGFMAVGAYTSALVSKALINAGVFTTVGMSGFALFMIALCCGAVMAALFGMIVGIPALRLRGDYLAIITLGFGEIIRIIIQNLKIAGGKGLSQGQAGQALIGIPKFNNLYIVFSITVISVAILYTFVRSKYGRAITAIRDDDIAAASVGLNTTYYKVLAFTVSALFAGIAGAIFAHRGLGTLQHNDFSFLKSTEYVIMVIIGGMGSLTGSIIAAVVLSVLPELLRTFAEYRMLVYSVALIIMMIFRPTGIAGRYEFSLYQFIKSIPSMMRRLVKRGKNGSTVKNKRLKGEENNG